MTILNYDAIKWIGVIKPQLSPFLKNIILSFHSILSFTLTKSLSVHVKFDYFCEGKENNFSMVISIQKSGIH